MKPRLIRPAGSDPQLVVPGRKRRQAAEAIDKTDIGIAQQLLGLLKNGYEKNQWPDFVLDYRPQGVQDDLGVVYHLLTLTRSRGYVLGLKAAEAALRRAKADCQEGLAKATTGDEKPGPEADQWADRLKGAQMALDRLQQVLDAVHVPGV